MLLFVEQFLNGLQLGLLLFLLAAGLTLVFGIMDLVNLAHGSLYMLGAFIAATFTMMTGSLVIGILLALPVMAMVGLLLELTIVRVLYQRDHLEHVLATFGLILCINTLAHIIWGPEGIAIPLPVWLRGQVEILPGVIFPAYRLVIIVTGLAIAALLYWIVSHTRLGMLIRAGASNRTMVSALGIDIADERAVLFLMIDLAPADVEIDGVGFGIIGHVVHRSLLAPLSKVIVITRIVVSVSTQTTRSTLPPNSSIL
jgi:branched-chain amino acid transport system permease protein